MKQLVYALALTGSCVFATTVASTPAAALETYEAQMEASENVGVLICWQGQSGSIFLADCATAGGGREVTIAIARTARAPACICVSSRAQ